MSKVYEQISHQRRYTEGKKEYDIQYNFSLFSL